MSTILDGSKLSKTIIKKIKTRVSSLSKQPGLAVILVGLDPASHTYVNLKQKACEEVGIAFKKITYPNSVSEKTIIDKITELNHDKNTHGVLVQLPLPSQNVDLIISHINPKKDVDGFHKDNLQKLRENKPSMAPAVALGIIKLICSSGVDLVNKKAVIVSSKLFAEPIEILLKELKVDSFVINYKEENFAEKIKTADIVITAIGKPGLINESMLKNSSIVIDVGTTKVNGKILGDVMINQDNNNTLFITPVPGGVGPMTVAMLLVNVLKAYQLQI